MSSKSGATLEDLLREQEEQDLLLASSGGYNGKKRKKIETAEKKRFHDSNQPQGDVASQENNRFKKPKKAHKNAPTEMKSNRPVSRHREVVLTSHQEHRDPRLVSIESIM